jgi:hypothetical protein
MPAVNTQIANAVSAQQRAMAYALAVFILHLLGDTSAPYLFGAVVDALGDTQKAFLIFSWSLLLAGSSCLLAARFAGERKAGSCKLDLTVRGPSASYPVYFFPERWRHGDEVDCSGGHVPCGGGPGRRSG